MELSEALSAKKKDIVGLWIDRTLDSYSSPGFFKKSTDPFANPVGSIISQGLTILYEHLLANAEQQEFVEPLDQVVRIRAVQDFAPSQAMAPFLELKWVIRQIFSASKETRHLLGELDKLDCRIDAMALAAFDNYLVCREQLFRNRIRELKSGRAILTDSACPSAIMRHNNDQSA
ncbi:RsbRD N-terminal domain-containing protein [Desulfobulbus alkaliphilus]|uniref:RsbRD N-terminal domain-containing protein n=1 Tax=Desulfobulbus alkaliphilus TaxID=869814 RepID=UPI001965F42F|nr:RsbRD N-terminal domain-containing protein [Desulfobulbus alkaliphilus]MBM9536647.1 RsbRD N-terminal domain-containing protein [Desulfobulbus alkaliphilus]